MPNAITIQGYKFEVPEGVLANFESYISSEAPEGLKSMVRQTICENLRNNYASKVKAAANGGELTPEQLADLQSKFDAYAGEYKPGVRSSTGGAGRVVRDPVEREMLKLAKEDISRAYMAKYNEKIDKEVLAEKADQLLDLKGDAYRKRANAIIRQRTQAGADDLAGLEI